MTRSTMVANIFFLKEKRTEMNTKLRAQESTKLRFECASRIPDQQLGLNEMKRAAR